jgi:hypothetical protein
LLTECPRAECVRVCDFDFELSTRLTIHDPHDLAATAVCMAAA